MKRIFIVFISILVFRNHAFAWRIGPIKGDDPKIPPVGDVVKGVENALPVSPRSIKCDQIRDDANNHQSALRQSLANVNAHLEMANTVVENKRKEKIKLEDRNSYLNKIDVLLSEFESINAGLIISDSNLKGALLNLQNRNTHQALNELLHSMENDTKNPQARQLAEVLRHLLNKNESEIARLLTNNDGKVLLEQFSVLIGTLKVLNSQEKAQVDAAIIEVNGETASSEEHKNRLIAQINQIHAEWLVQEERKSCKF